MQPKLYFHILSFLLFFWCSLKWVIRIVYFPIPYSKLSLPVNFCVSYCFQVLLGGLHIPRCIWKHMYCGDSKIVNYFFTLYIEPFRLVCFVFPTQTMWCSQSRMSFFFSINYLALYMWIGRFLRKKLSGSRVASRGFKWENKPCLGHFK